jgi:hypothetical protein
MSRQTYQEYPVLTANGIGILSAGGLGPAQGDLGQGGRACLCVPVSLTRITRDPEMAPLQQHHGSPGGSTVWQRA